MVGPEKTVSQPATGELSPLRDKGRDRMELKPVISTISEMLDVKSGLEACLGYEIR